MGLTEANPWRTISFQLMAIFLIVVSLVPLPRLYAEIGTEKGNCSYTLEVKTDCGFTDTGTDNHVRVRFMNKNRRNVTNHHLKEPIEKSKDNPFSRCAAAKFSINGPCLKGEVCNLQFKVEGTDNWKVQHANVHGESISSFGCIFNKRLPSNAWWGYNLCDFEEERASASPAMYYACSKNENWSKQKSRTRRSSAKRVRKIKRLSLSL